MKKSRHHFLYKYFDNKYNKRKNTPELHYIHKELFAYVRKSY